MDEVTAMLRLLVYYRNPPMCNIPVYFKRCSWDFGDAQAGVFLEIAEHKIVAERCGYPEAQVLVKERRYVYNLNGSFSDKEEYLIVKEEILRAHTEVHMPVKEFLLGDILES